MNATISNLTANFSQNVSQNFSYRGEYINGFNAGFQSGVSKFHQLIIVLFVTYFAFVVVSALKRRGIKEEWMRSIENALVSLDLMIVTYLFVTNFLPPLMIT